MKLRHVLKLAGIAVLTVAAVVSCSLLGMSITDRVGSFQTDLNSADRSSIYTNFDSANTSDYNALKSASTIIDQIFPVLGTGDTPYALAITNESNPSTGVLVTVTGGPALFGGTHHLKLVMDNSTSLLGDWQIVTLSMDNGSGVYLSTPQIQ
jgi:hypothetical protein